MVLTDENYKEKIKSFSELEWQPLLDLIPEIENTSNFGKMAGGGKNENGSITMPYWEQNAIVSKFIDVVYNIPIIINFDWVSWDEGRKIARDEEFDYDTIDIPAKCKLVTAIVRNDRFCDGALVAAFESGLIPRILKSIKNQIGKALEPK